MMAVTNPVITIVGRLGQDPEPIGSGLRLRVVTNDRAKNEQGAWEDRDTSWWTVKAWKTLAEQSKAVLKKGQEVIIVGKIREENWTNPTTGEKRTSYELIADSIAVTTYSLQKNNSDSSSHKNYAEVPF